MKYKRIFTIIVDSLGVGEMPDCKAYGDENVDTLGHLSNAVESFNIPNMQKLGFANLHPIGHVEPLKEPVGYYAKMMELSNGKDTMTGHWEIMGLHITTPFKTFTDTGFPIELIDELEKETGHKIIGNKSASGTEILDELGEEHLRTNDMIVYTSADSVLQIACHEETFGLDELYRCCEIARKLTLRDEYKVGRIIARPFLGDKKGAFARTSNRHDYALKPFGRTVLNELKDHGFDVISRFFPFLKSFLILWIFKMFLRCFCNPSYKLLFLVFGQTLQYVHFFIFFHLNIKASFCNSFANAYPI